ncbi:TPA: addiction module toxin RelE [Enterococcus faecium]
MATEKKRIKIALSDRTIENLEYLMSNEQQKGNKRIYPCDVFERLLENEVKIIKTFGNQD